MTFMLLNYFLSKLSIYFFQIVNYIRSIVFHKKGGVKSMMALSCFEFQSHTFQIIFVEFVNFISEIVGKFVHVIVHFVLNLVHPWQKDVHYEVSTAGKNNGCNQENANTAKKCATTVFPVIRVASRHFNANGFGTYSYSRMKLDKLGAFWGFKWRSRLMSIVYFFTYLFWEYV